MDTLVSSGTVASQKAVATVGGMAGAIPGFPFKIFPKQTQTI